MRVVLNGWFWNNLGTGSGQYARRLAEALIAADVAIELHVFVPSGEGHETVCAASSLTLRVRDAPRTQLGKLHWEQVLMPRWARQAGADLLHVPYWAPPLKATLPVVVTAHDIIPLILPAYRGGPHVRAYTALVSAATSRARLVLTDSDASRRDILRYLRIAPERVRAVPLAVDSAYHPTAAPQDARLRDELGIHTPYILYVGGFDVRKNLPVVFQAFDIVRRACPDTNLVVAGRLPTSDTAFAPDPRRLAREAQLEGEAVRFCGFVSEVQKLALYRGARAFICPSSYEGFGYPALEALACGVPVVASDASSLPEVVGDAGILLDSGDSEGMAGALIQLLIDDAFHAEMVQRAVRQSRRFSWQKTAQQTLDAYRDIA